MKWNGIRPMANTNPRKHYTQIKPHSKFPRAYRIPIVSGRGKWIDETLKETMDAEGIITLH